jgi:hypothetical protein
MKKKKSKKINFKITYRMQQIYNHKKYLLIRKKIYIYMYVFINNNKKKRNKDSKVMKKGIKAQKIDDFDFDNLLLEEE